MDDDQSSVCPHCGEHHPVLLFPGQTVPTVAGSRMRHGGPFTDPSGITIGTDEWRQMRCGFCGAESMTPAEVISPFAHQLPDGAYLGHCSSCDFDLKSGHKPGHNPNRRRRRRR